MELKPLEKTGQEERTKYIYRLRRKTKERKSTFYSFEVIEISFDAGLEVNIKPEFSNSANFYAKLL